MTPTDDDFRAVGFTAAARNFPRDDFASVLFAAFNGVPVEKMPEAFRYFPNGSTAKAWGRVAEAARRFLDKRKEGSDA